MVSAAESWCCIYEGLSPFTSSFLYNQLFFFFFFSFAARWRVLIWLEFFRRNFGILLICVKCEWHVHRRFLSGFLFLHFLIHHVLYRWIWLVYLWSQRIIFLSRHVWHINGLSMCKFKVLCRIHRLNFKFSMVTLS